MTQLHRCVDTGLYGLFHCVIFKKIQSNVEDNPKQSKTTTAYMENTKHCL